MIGGQVLIIFVGGRAFNVTRLNGPQWGISIVLGVLSIPMGIVIRLIPDIWVAKMFPFKWRKRWLPESITPEEEKLAEFEEGPSELAFLRRIKGGRLNSMRLRTKTFGDEAEFDNRMRAEASFGR